MITYTCILDEYDELKLPFYPGRFVAYLDSLITSPIWETRLALTPFKDTTRNARLHKVLSHQFIEDEWSLWMDGSISLKVSPQAILEKYGRSDLVMFKAAQYDCAYIEGRQVIEVGVGDPNIVTNQLNQYRSQGYPEHHGLSVTGCILRHHTPEVVAFNNAWWSEISRHSKRDQISVDYVTWKLGVKIAYFDGSVFDSPEFELHPHRKGRP